MADFGGLESFRFIPRGVEVNGHEFVSVHELENCQRARERLNRAYSEAWNEIKRLRKIVFDYAIPYKGGEGR